jgi:hypothetical protein
MKTIEIVQSLLNPESNHRITLEQAWDQDSEEFWIGLSLGTSPDYDFKVSNVPALPDDDEEPGTLTFAEFYDLALKLHHGDLVGISAQDAIENTALSADAKEWNLWYRRILLKSLSKHLPMKTIQEELIRLTTE